MKVVKESKEIQHAPLVTETLRRTSPRFVSTPTFIEKCIRSLVDKDYLAQSIE